MSAGSSGESASLTSDLAARSAIIGGAGGTETSTSGIDRAIALFAGALTFVIATIALAGWALGIVGMTTLWPGGAPMIPGAALGLKAGGASLMLAFGPARLRYLQIALALAVAAFGLFSLIERAFGLSFGLNGALLPPSAFASANFLAIGLALTLVVARNATLQCLRATLSMAAFVMAATCLLGYVVSPIDRTVHEVLPGLSFNCSVAFMALSSGVLAAGRSRPSSRRYIAPVLGLIVLGVLVSTSLLDVGLQERAQTEARQADRVCTGLSRLLDLVRDAETGQRGYLLTGDDHDLEPYDSAAPAVTEEVREIEGLIGGDPASRAQLAQVQALASEELDDLRHPINLRRAGDTDGALAAVRTDAGTAAMDRMRSAIAELQNAEAGRVATFTDAAHAYGVQLQVSTLTTVSLVGALAAFLILDGRRRFRQLWRAQDQLQSLNQNLDQLVSQRTADLSSALAERRRAEEALRNSEAALRESPAVGIAHLTPDAKFIRVNARLCELLGYSSRELLERSLQEITHPDDLAACLAQAQSLITGGASYYSLEKRLIAKDRRLVWVNMTRSLVRRSTGEPDYVVVLIEDICARKAADLALQEREARLRSIIDTAPDAVIAVCGRGLIETFSRSAERLFGYEASEVLGRSIDVLIPSLGDGDEFDMERLAPAEPLHRASAGRSVQATAERKNGSAFPVELSVGEALIGETRIIIVFIRDLTARQRIEQQLRQAQRMEAIGQLTGGLAHDFNNLLTVIMGNLEMLESRCASESDVALVREARETAEDGARLVRDLLAFGRRQALQPQLTDLGAFVKSMEALLRRTLGETIDVTTHLETSLHWAFVDGSQLQNALLNLVINARDAMPDGGALVINLQTVFRRVDVATPRDGPTGRYAQITVTDTGVGMSKETQQRVFEPFFTTKPAGAGTGLGLSMVYGFAKQSSGLVELSSEPGRGTSVRLLLPACDAPLETAETTAAPDTQVRQGGREKILVVEDDPRVRRVAMARLAELGYDAFEAYDAPSALEMAADTEMDLLFTDIVMPGGMTGFDLAKNLRATRPKLKVLYTSGYAEPELVTRNQGEETHWLGKPYSAAELAKALREALANSQDH